LKPVAGLRIDLGATHPLLLAPDRRRLLTSGENQLRVADLRTGRVSKPMSPGGWVTWALWTRPNTIAAVTGTRVVLVDARKMEATRYVDLNGAVLAAARAGSRLVLLVGPEDAVGTLRIAIVDGSGALRSRPLPMRGGNATLRNDERNPVGMRTESPGLAVDAAGRRAVVVGRTALLEVDLSTLEATTRTLVERTTQKRVEGWWRSALWLDTNHVAVSGAEYSGDHSAAAVPVQVVDIRDWTARTLDAKTSYVTSWHGNLLTVGDTLRAYRPDGELVSTILPQRFGGQVAGGETWLYVETSGRGTKWLVLDWDGRVMGRRTFARPMNVAVLP
jgi:hypothetical protein